MKRPAIVGWAVLTFALVAANAHSESFGSILVFSDQVAWEAAVSNIYVEDFNSQQQGEFDGIIDESGFNGFSLSGTKEGDRIGIRSGNSPANVNGTAFLGWDTVSDPGSGGTLVFSFHRPTNAFAFNWSDIDPTDEFQLLVDGQLLSSVAFSIGTSSGFFGFVKQNGDIQSVTIRNIQGTDELMEDISETFGIDNVRTGHAPEPSTLSILGLGGICLALGAAIKRRRKARNPG